MVHAKGNVAINMYLLVLLYKNGNPFLNRLILKKKCNVAPESTVAIITGNKIPSLPDTFRVSRAERVSIVIRTPELIPIASSPVVNAKIDPTSVIFSAKNDTSRIIKTKRIVGRCSPSMKTIPDNAPENTIPKSVLLYVIKRETFSSLTKTNRLRNITIKKVISGKINSMPITLI